MVIDLFYKRQRVESDQDSKIDETLDPAKATLVNQQALILGSVAVGNIDLDKYHQEVLAQLQEGKISRKEARRHYLHSLQLG